MEITRENEIVGVFENLLKLAFDRSCFLVLGLYLVGLSSDPIPKNKNPAKGTHDRKEDASKNEGCPSNAPCSWWRQKLDVL